MNVHRPLLLSLWTSLVLAFVLMFGVAAIAQDPPPLARDFPYGTTSYSPPGPAEDRDGGKPASGLERRRDLRASQPSARAADVGEPGLSFRHVQTFGESEVAYFDDANHLNGPGGLGSDGASIWIAECDGRRALKYGSNGAFSTQIGAAGFRYGTDTTHECLMDVAVDSIGSVWVVDGGANHVIQYDAGGDLVRELGEEWGWGHDNEHFAWPAGIAFDNAGNVYVSDQSNHRVQVFDSSGVYLVTLGVTNAAGSDNTHFNYPSHITIDSNNRLYVADRDNHRVQIFDVSNVLGIAYVGTIGVPGVSGSDNTHLNTPEGVAVDLARGRIYVADAYNWRVQVFDYATRAYQNTLGGFSYVSDVAVDAAGNLYAAEPWTDGSRVQQFDANLNYVRTYGRSGVPYLTDGYHYHQPAGVAVAPDGSIYVGESRGRRLVKLAAGGAPSWVRGEPGQWGGDNNHFTYVEDVALDAGGRVYAVDTANHRVQIYAADGSYYATLGTGYGDGDYEFNRPVGVAIGAKNRIYVADGNNHRVQVFDENRVYLSTLGQTGVSGSDNAHFAYPRDVDVDRKGNVYVADQDNHRVQIFGSNHAYARTLGESGVAGDDFGHLNSPTAVTVDEDLRVYVADQWGSRVQVFDRKGAYLTTIGRWGGDPGQLRDAEGLALDAAGNLYVAERENHRIQKFSSGTPGWVQTNINGFGDSDNGYILSLEPFQGHLYAGTWNWAGNGAQLWRAADGRTWAPVVADGFEDSNNEGIDDLLEFQDRLYATTWNWDSAIEQSRGGQVWRSDDGATWEQVVAGGFGDPGNGEVFCLADFQDRLYAATWSYTTTHGAEIWRSDSGDSGDWQRVVQNGFGNVSNQAVTALTAFDGHLYAGTYNWDPSSDSSSGAGVWRSGDGVSWVQVNLNGFGDAANYAVPALAVFKDHLYAGTWSWDPGTEQSNGAEIWRCPATSGCDQASDWSRVVAGGFGSADNRGLDGLFAFEGRLYAVTYNFVTGMEVWRSGNGTTWRQTGFGGFGDSSNRGSYWNLGLAVFGDRLYIGTRNSANGGEIWKKTVTAGFDASPTRGTPPLTVQFANSSAGDYTTSLWDFGDGQTSTETDPSHVFDLGRYDVKLTVSDGVDTSTATREAYVQAMHGAHLPTAMRSHDPWLYDDFDNPAYDGIFNQGLWSFYADSAFQVRQEAGGLVLTSNSSAPDDDGASFNLIWPMERTLAQAQAFEARLKLGSDLAGGWASVQISQNVDGIAGHDWHTECFLGASAGSQPELQCYVATHGNNFWNEEYRTGEFPAQYDTWYTTRIEIEPETATLRFYVDGVLIGSHTPLDAAALVTAGNCRAKVSIWNGDPGVTVTRYVDEVRITPVEP